MRTLALVALLGVSSTGFRACADPPSPPPSNGALPARTPLYVVEVVKEYPHDTRAFTQGLQWHEDRLFESTGQVGKSDIREVELRTGRVLRKRDLPPPHFGEGMVILGDNLYQVTWTTESAFVYDWRTFQPRSEFKYEGQGWGLTSDGSAIIMSNGTSVLQFRDPKTFDIVRTVTVTDNDVQVSKLNELEWVKGEVWANVWESEQIARIDPESGKVLGWVDLTGILSPLDRTGAEDVLNGIAYDAKQDRIFVTGKNWPKLFEIRLKDR